MVRVVTAGPFGTEFFDGAAEFEVEAATLFELVERLGPAFAAVAPDRVTFAVDGELAADWSVRLAPGAEVLLVPRIAGGQDA